MLHLPGAAGETGRWCALGGLGEASGSHLGRRLRAAFTFIAPRRLSCEPLTRARVRLLGPCFKTGRVGGRHRRGPRALAWRSCGSPRRDPPGPTARPARGALGTVRPAPTPPHPRGGGEAGRGGRAVAPWEGRPGPPGKRPRRAPRGGRPLAGAAPRGGGSAGRGESAATRAGSLGPGIRRALLPGGCNTRGGWARRRRETAAGPPRATFPRRAFPAVPEPVAAHRRGGNAPGGARSPAGGRSPADPTPGPARPPPRPPRRRPPPARRRTGGRRRGAEGGRVEGSGGTGSGKDPPGRRHGRARRRVESSGRTARTPPVYLLTVSRPLELSLQSSFQLSLTVLVDYRSRAGI